MGGQTEAPEPESSGQSLQLLLSMNDFADFKQIGKGKDCVVYSASCEKLGGHSVVLKVYDKAKISAIKHRSVRREARIMRYLTDKRVPHTTAYTGAFQDSKQIYIVMEHCKGGDLLEQLLKEGRAMPEKRVVREVVLPSLTALAHLHAAGVIHRDIKLENLFISSRGHLQLGDFGLAISVLEERAISPVGTLEYMAPEILRLPSTDLVLKGAVRVEDIAPIDEKVDVWSFGVTVYELVTGRSPFEGTNKDEIKAAILGFQMRPLPGFLTPGCQDFILKCLCPKAGDRPSALALLSHPWVQLHCTPADLVTIARLPLQLPKVPMGYKPCSSSSSSANANGTQQQTQQAVDTAASVCSTSTAASVSQSPGSTPRQAVSVGEKPPGRLIQGPEAKLQPNSSSSTSSPDSPQIPAFMPSGVPGSPACMTGGSAGSVVSTVCSHADARCSTSSHSSHSSSVMHGAAGFTPHGPPSLNHSVSTESVRSNLGLPTNDSAVSLYQQSLAAVAAGLVSSSSHCSSQQQGISKTWAPAPPGLVTSAGWGQEPIQESPTDESAATAASMATHASRSENGSFSQQQLRQQQYLMQYQQQPPAGNCLQHPQQHMQEVLLEHMAASGKALGAVTATPAGAAEKHKKQHSNGKKLWKWMCTAAGAARPNVSV